MSICYFGIIKDIFAILVSILTLLLAFFGLSTWRRKLWGENEFTLATSCFIELFNLKEEIKVYRNPFYSIGEIYIAIKEYKSKNPNEEIKDETSSVYAENRRWNNVIEKYNHFSEVLVKLKVILNNYSLDEIDNCTIETYIQELSVSRVQLQLSREEKFNLVDYSEDQRKEYSKTLKKMASILYRNKPNDEFEQKIEKYFIAFNQRIRKYIPQ
jgi:hypothetical protein